jgi:hypothetical protein
MAVGATLRQTGRGGKSAEKESTVFSLDDMSVVEWLATTRWTAEMSADLGNAPGHCEQLTCAELAWSLILQAADEGERRDGYLKVTYAA